jgi:ankyrin repeat protein
LEVEAALSLEAFFAEVSEDQTAAYTAQVVRTVRNDDLEALKQLHSEGQILNCSNRFGESILSLACRGGYESIVDYLLSQPDSDVQICDDSGRTPSQLGQ